MKRPNVASRPMLGVVAGLALAVVTVAGGANPAPAANPTLDLILKQCQQFGLKALDWYRQTPPVDRVTWGGLGACGVLGFLVLCERSWSLRKRRITPGGFLKRFRERIQDGKLDRGKALDLCELNPSPVARVALAAVKRWGRPVADIERAVNLASKVETNQLRRNVGTLRRLAALTPLLGLLGSLISAGRALSVPGASWGPAVGMSLMPLTAGVAMAIIALVAYDGMMGKVEKLAGTIDRLGAETVDAIAMSSTPEPTAPPVPGSRPLDIRRSAPGLFRGPHPIRVEIPEAITRHLEDDEYDD